MANVPDDADHGPHRRTAKTEASPTGSCLPQYTRAMDSLITTTSGASSTSDGLNARPRIIGMPMVSKYPSLTGR